MNMMHYDSLTLKSIARNFIMLNTMTGNESKHHNLRQRSQRKDRNMNETFAFVLHRSI